MGEGHFSPDGALMVQTGTSTGRSTKERYLIQHPEVENEIEWGSVNQPLSPDFGKKFFAALEERVMNHEPPLPHDRFCGVFSHHCEFKKPLAYRFLQKYVPR